MSLSGTQEKFTANKDQGVPYIIGRTAVAGFIVHRQTYDFGGSTNNAYQTFYGVWGGGGPISAVESFMADSTVVSFSGTAATGGYAGYMWLDTQLGATPESDALQASPGAGYPAGWSASSKMSGYAAFAWTVKFDTNGKKYPGAVIPQPLAVLKGVLVYDPRLDSTYPGGSGSCRPLVESTYVYSQNPFLHALTWALGRWQNGKRVLGIGMALASIDVPAAVYAANIADANAWKVGGVVYSTDGKWDVLKKICAAGSGEPLQLGGMLSFTVDAPRVSLATITTDQIIGDCTVTATAAMKDRINGVIPTCRSESHSWSLVPGALVQIGAYVTADGRPRTRGITYELCQDFGQVAELAAYTIVNSREFGPIVTPLKLKWAGYKPGDCLTIASDEIGMSSQMVVVLKRHLDPPSGAVTLTMRSETYAKHAFALGQTTTPPPTPALQTVDRSLLGYAGIVTSILQGSVDGTTWHSPPASGDVYIRASNDGGATWGGAIPLGGDGQLAEGSVDGSTGWHLPPEAGDNYLRYSTDGGITWGSAVQITGEAGPGQYQQFVFIRSATAPATPTGDGIPSGWSDGVPTGATLIWMSVATQIGGVTQGTWSTPAQIKGSDGSQGPQGPTGGTGPQGNDAPLLAIQFSANNSSWHYGFVSGDLYIRMSADNGVTWGLGAPFIGKGIRYAFIQSTTQPATPSTTGTTYPPSGWSAAPTATGIWWASFAQFDSSGNITNGPTWTTPFQATGSPGATGGTGPAGDPGADGLGSGNRLKWTRTEFGTRGYVVTRQTNCSTFNFLAGSYGGHKYIGAQSNTTGTSAQYGLGNSSETYFKVTPGERLAISTGVFNQSASTVRTELFIWWMDASNNAVSPVVSAVASQNGLLNIGNSPRIGGFVTVPAGGVYARLETYFTAGSGSMTMDCGIFEQMVSEAAPGQTTLPAFSPGSNAADGATSGANINAAQAITGPGSFSYPNTVVVPPGGGVNFGGSLNFAASGAAVTVTMQVLYNINGGGFSAFPGGSQSGTALAGEPNSVAPSGSYQNTSTANVTVGFRTDVTKTGGGTATYSSGSVRSS